MTTTPVNVLIVVTSLSPGGIESYIMNVLSALDRTNFNVTIVCTGELSDWFRTDLDTLGVKLLLCPNPYSQIGYIRKISRIIQDLAIDVVCDFRNDFAAPTLWAAKRLGVPIRIAMYRSTGRGFRPGLFRDAYAAVIKRCTRRWATQLIGNTRAVLDARYPTWKHDDKCVVIPNGVDLQRFRPGRCGRHVRAALGIPHESIVIGHVGRFHPAKNHTVLLRSFAALQNKTKHVHFLLVGDGDLRPQIETTIHELHLGRRVTLAGRRKDVEEMLAGMDIFFYPSRYEGLPNALLEAMACGLPFVASDIPEIAEVLPPALRTQLIACDDTSGFASSLRDLHSSSNTRAKIGRHARQWVEQHYSIEASRAQLCAQWARARNTADSAVGKNSGHVSSH